MEKEAPVYQVLVGQSYYFVTGIDSSPEGFISPFKDWERWRQSNFLRVNGQNINLYNGLYLKHNNIVYCHSVHHGGQFDLLAYEPFSEYLRDIYTNTALFWRYDLSGEIIGGTEFLQRIILGVLDALIFLSKKAGLCHGNTSSLDCIVFDTDRTPMLFDFGWSSKNPDGLKTDIQGLGKLLRQLIPVIKFEKMTYEIKSLIFCLENYDATKDPMILKQHPALESPEERREMVLEAASVIKSDQSIGSDWAKYLSDRGMGVMNLRFWVWVAQQSKDSPIKDRTLRIQNSQPEYHDCPLCLNKFVRDTYVHIRDNNQNSNYTDTVLADLFKDLYPNLYVEWYYFRNLLPAQSDELY